MRTCLKLILETIFCFILVYGAYIGMQPQYEQQQRIYEERMLRETQQHVTKVISILEGDKTIIKRSQVRRPKVNEAYAVISNDKRDFTKEIYFGDSLDILSISIGQYEFSGIPGEGKPILLAGHNSTQFKQLRYFEKGDHVKIDTDYGSFLYEVDHMETILADDFDAAILDKEEELLIMYCCYPFDSLSTDYRYFVYANKIDGPEIEGEGSWKE